MFYAIEVQIQQAQERIEREVALASARSRLAVEPRSSIRRAIGHRFMQIGARLAAEPPLESVRSRCGPHRLTTWRSSDDRRP